MYFRYRLLYPDGKIVQGTLTAKDITDARARLINRNGTLLYLKKQRVLFAVSNSVSQGPRVHSVIKQLALMTGASLPLRESLALIIKQQTNEHLRFVLETVYQQICQGISLSSALAQHPRYFDALCCATIAAGEQSGDMATVLEGYANYLDEQHQLRRALRQAMSYPVLLMVVSCLIVGLLLMVAVPQIVAQLSLSGVALPWSTRLVLSIGEGMRAYSLPVTGGTILSLAVVSRALRHEKRQRSFHGCLLRLPFLGALLKQIQQVKLLMTLSILCTTAVPVADALRLSCRALSNQWLQAKGAAAVQALTEGQPFTRAMAAELLLPVNSLALLQAGEQGGKLADALRYVARMQREALQQRLLGFVKLLEPAMILLLGGVVLLVFMAIIQPMLAMNAMAS